MLVNIPGSVISMDIGIKRIGLAGCDALGITITELKPIHRTSFQEDLNKLKSVCLKRNAKGLVMGLPLDMEGMETKQSSYTKKYGLKIAKELNLPLAWVNEHCSTWEASLKYGLSKDRTGKLDSAAAALLLDQWLKEGPDLEFS